MDNSWVVRNLSTGLLFDIGVPGGVAGNRRNGGFIAVLFVGDGNAVKLRYIRCQQDAEIGRCASPDLNESARRRVVGVVPSTRRISLVSPEYANRA